MKVEKEKRIMYLSTVINLTATPLSTFLKC